MHLNLHIIRWEMKMIVCSFFITFSFNFQFIIIEYAFYFQLNKVK